MSESTCVRVPSYTHNKHMNVIYFYNLYVILLLPDYLLPITSSIIYLL